MSETLLRGVGLAYPGPFSAAAVQGEGAVHSATWRACCGVGWGSRPEAALKEADARWRRSTRFGAGRADVGEGLAPPSRRNTIAVDGAGARNGNPMFSVDLASHGGVEQRRRRRSGRSGRRHGIGTPVLGRVGLKRRLGPGYRSATSSCRRSSRRPRPGRLSLLLRRGT